MSDPRPVAITVALPESALEKLRARFRIVHYHPDGEVPSVELPNVQLWLAKNIGLPPCAGPISELAALKHIQLVSAGAEKALANELIKAYAASPAASRPDAVTLSTASGLHVLSIPNYVVAMIINIYSQIYHQVSFCRQKKGWAEGDELDQSGEPVFFNRMTYGRTVGFLGYGALGRESARLCKALGMNVIAANTTGKATPQTGYMFPGTGDQDGSIPSKYYNTEDRASVQEFLQACDVLVCSLPATAKTCYFLDRHSLALLPKRAVLINIGRGSLIKSDELQAALDVPDHLLGAAIDVTDPEPLPDNHPLWSHPKLLITPHLSGDTEGELGLAADIFLANAERIKENKPVYNQVHFDRGY